MSIPLLVERISIFVTRLSCAVSLGEPIFATNSVAIMTNSAVSRCRRGKQLIRDFIAVNSLSSFSIFFSPLSQRRLVFLLGDGRATETLLFHHPSQNKTEVFAKRGYGVNTSMKFRCSV